VVRTPDISLVISSFERPRNLERSLTSIARQAGVDGRFEVVISDDGSEDETAELVRAFARSVDFPVRYVTHPHEDFQLARCRNEGAMASRAPYLLFLDGDCVLPPDHVALHLEKRREGIVMGGDCVRLGRDISERVTVESVKRGDLPEVPASELKRLRVQAWKARFYNLIQHPTKPKVIGNNIGIWRSDYESINGYDENFIGWGCEDDDFRIRVHRAGLTVRSILDWTFTYHLWHPADPSQPQRWRQGRNVGYFSRPVRLTRCRNGLRKRSNKDLGISYAGIPRDLERAGNLIRATAPEGAGEVEVLILPGSGRFSGRADCNILVVLDDAPEARKHVPKAHLVIFECGDRGVAHDSRMGWPEVDQALAAVQ
jgi:glycosyltransferase involved in cell wall biosynthesis